jgi:hypothetical protein
MAYRGAALVYRIRKTTINNKTGDNYAITIPRYIAEQFRGWYFTISVSGNSIIFTSGCKITQEDIPPKFNLPTKVYFDKHLEEYE